MLALFNRLKLPLWNTVNTVMAEPLVVWISNDHTLSFTGAALFNDPTEKELLDGSDFRPAMPHIEFPATAFIGLKERVDANPTEPEQVSVNGVYYYVRSVQKYFDGENLKAYLELVNNPNGPQNQ